MSGRRLAALNEAAEYLGVSTKSVRNWIDAGYFPGYRMGPRLILVDLNEVDAALAPIPTTGDLDGLS